MRRRLAAILLVVALSACGGGVPTGSPPDSVAPTSSPVALTVSCSHVASATCDLAKGAVLLAVAPSGWTPTHLWMSSESLCPAQDCLFDPDSTFPYPTPPEGGRWIGNAEVAFAETDEHAGLNLATVGTDVVPVLIGYRVPLLTWCSGECPTESTEDGPFSFELVMPHLTWHTTDPISGTAILGFDGEEPTTIYGSSEGVIAFSYEEVGGDRQVDWVMTADCGPHLLDPATPISVGLSKSGAVSGDEPDAGFLRTFLADPEIHLPAGTWDIHAVAVFSETPDCTDGSHTIQLTQRVTVTP